LSRKVVLATKQGKNPIFLSIYHPLFIKNTLLNRSRKNYIISFTETKSNYFFVVTNFREVVYLRRVYEISDREDGKDCGGKI
jgi:hypothetical protein